MKRPGPAIIHGRPAHELRSWRVGIKKTRGVREQDTKGGDPAWWRRWPAGVGTSPWGGRAAVRREKSFGGLGVPQENPPPGPRDKRPGVKKPSAREEKHKENIKGTP